MMPQSATATQPKRRRASKPRTKTGCLTCRRRRLKCDEKKPTCFRCSKSNYPCEGYGNPIKESTLPPKITPRNILPEDSEIGLSRLRPSELLSTWTEVESKYIRYFQHKSTSGLEGMMNWSIWNHLVLQLSNREPFIHDSCVAIGALLKAVELTESTFGDEAPGSNAHSLQMAKMHREYALLKYGKAVKAMQAALVGAALRQVLIACLLVYCFENLLSNRHMALSHVETGEHLLREWLVRYDQVIPNDRHVHSPAPAIIDDELVEAFDHIDLQISTIYDSRPLELHEASISEGLTVVQRLPSTFKDLSEAQRYLVVIMRRSHHFLATTWPSSKSRSFARDFEMSTPEDIIVTTGVNIYSTSYRVSDTLRAEQKGFADDISRWSRAFQPLFNSMRRAEFIGSRNHIVATLLRIHAIATTVVVAGVIFTNEISYDVFLPQFQELFTLATIIVDAHRKKAGLTSTPVGFFLDLGITAPLFLLITRCRNHSLRVNAIELLRGWHVEACWQPRLIAEIGDFVMDVEEDGNTDGFIPERSRVVFTAVCDEPQRQTKHEAVLQCVQRYGGPDGSPVWHERRVFY